MSSDTTLRSSPNTRGAFSSQTEVAQTKSDLLSRTPPHSIQAEQAVLCAMLSSNRDSIATIIDILQHSEDFYDARHGHIFSAMLKLYEANKPLEYAAVYEQLRAMGLEEQSGGIQYLAQLSMAIVSSANAEFYANIVKNRAIQRRLITTCADIIG
ncbi:MAG: replicative DNA helicase, partial [Desulfovibrio sp.]|nr:replicative DNA helicase [Desulfovibrio sp.]